MKKILFSALIGLFGYWLIGLLSPSPSLAQLPSFSWIVTNQNGYPLQGAVVWVNLNGTYIATCTTDAAGVCSETISCAPPCQLDGNVGWQGYTGNYGGSFLDGAIISVTVDVPSVSPSPPPGPSPSPSPDCVGYDESCMTKECCEPYVEQFSEQTGACTCVYPISPGPLPPTISYKACDWSSCTPINPFDPSACYNSRPNQCEVCNAYQPDTFSCATSFTTYDKIKYQWEDSDDECEGKHWVERGWGGVVTVDSTQTTIPFVGKKGEEDEQKYLADYFEGTHEYYRQYPFSIGPVSLHGTNTTLLPNYQGVSRKLTPMEYQDELKKEMVQVDLESRDNLGQVDGGIQNYHVAYHPRLCWDFPFLSEALAAVAQNIAEVIGNSLSIDSPQLLNYTHFCLYNVEGPEDTVKIFAIREILKAHNAAMDQIPIIGQMFKIDYEYEDGATDDLAELANHFPPEPDEENYLEKWQAWKESDDKKWFKLWQATPMFSREDSWGQIIPYAGLRPVAGESFTILNPEAQKTRIPHLARLYETTQEIQEILIPNTATVLGTKTEAKTNQPIIASPGEEKVQEDKTLLAQGENCTIPFACMYWFSNNENPYDCSCWWNKKDNGDPSCRGEVGGCCQAHQGWPICGVTDCQGLGSERCPAYPGYCCPGELIGPGSVPSIPTCGLPEARPVNTCDREPALTDTNPNDIICGNNINSRLIAKDKVINTDYTPCEYDINCCNNPLALSPCLCNPECKNWNYPDVSRDIGVYLLHPYLTDIWNQSTNGETLGIFNIFRPNQISKYDDWDAKSEINYGYIDESDPYGGYVNPSSGDFYYPYLGGVQKAKEWVTTKVLMPYVEQ